MENGQLTQEANAAMAGVLNRLPDMTLFLNPIPNSYDRLTDSESPSRVCWSTLRGRNALRLPLPQHRFARMQVTSPDPACNVYLAYSLIIRAALEGMEKQETLPPMVQDGWENVSSLPESLPDALAVAGSSDFIARSLPACVVNEFLRGGEKLLALDRQDKTRLFQNQFERF